MNVSIPITISFINIVSRMYVIIGDCSNVRFSKESEQYVFQTPYFMNVAKLNVICDNNLAVK